MEEWDITGTDRIKGDWNPAEPWPGFPHSGPFLSTRVLYHFSHCCDENTRQSNLVEKRFIRLTAWRCSLPWWCSLPWRCRLSQCCRLTICLLSRHGNRSMKNLTVLPQPRSIEKWVLGLSSLSLLYSVWNPSPWNNLSTKTNTIKKLPQRSSFLCWF